MEIRIESIKDKKEAELRRIWETIPPSRGEELKQIKQEQSKLRSLIGEWLVRQMLEAKTGIKADEIIILREKNKKPRLENDKIHFNISHSGDYVIAAVGENPIGIDIEKKSRDLTRVIKRICSEEDWRLIEEAPSNELRHQTMYEIWTRKEALVKCIGTGIFTPAFKQTVGTGKQQIRIGNNQYLLQTINGPENYCCAVCEREK